MRHIKIYEDYSDDDLRDLIGDLKSVGHSRVPLDIDYGPVKGMGDKNKEKERNTVESWSFSSPEGEIKVKSGSVKFSPQKDLKVVLNMSNGDLVEMEVDPRGLRTSFSVNGEFPEPIIEPGPWGNEYPQTQNALMRYEQYLGAKYYRYDQKKPTFLQRLKGKLGLSESYSDDELMDLLGDMKSIGQAELRIEIKDGHRSGMSSQEREEEKEFLSSWFFDSPKGKIKITSALMDYSAGESKIALKMNNGDVFEMKWSNSESMKYFINGREIYLESEREEEEIVNSDFPLEFASASAVLGYQDYLKGKYRTSKNPSFIGRLKGKLGLKESEYSEEELKALLGDMRSVGQSTIPLDINYGPFTGMGEKDKREEMEVVDPWSFKTPEGEIRVKSGSVKFSPDKQGTVILNMTNGDVIMLKDEKGGDYPLFYVNDTLIINSEGGEDSPYMEEYPYTLAALTRYELYLENKYKGKPSLLQRIKGKLGLSESYSDEELKALLGDMRSVGQSLTEEEEDMLEFVNQFGGGMTPDDYAETLYDYFTNPEEYGIDKEGDYYDMIWYLYENSAEDHSRYNLSSPMKTGIYARWDTTKIAQEPLYKLYLKMSDYYGQNRK